MIHNTSGGFLISQIKQVGGRIFDRLLQTAGVDAFNGAQGRILYVLWQQDCVPIAEIVKKTGLAKKYPYRHAGTYGIFRSDQPAERSP